MSDHLFAEFQEVEQDTYLHRRYRQILNHDSEYRRRKMGQLLDGCLYIRRHARTYLLRMYLRACPPSTWARIWNLTGQKCGLRG